jgi:predicted ester cyclase
VTIEANKALVRRLHEQFESEGRLEVADELLASSLRSSRRPGRATGPDGAKRHLTMLRAAFPDLRVTVEDLAAEGDLVAARLTMRGTHQGAFHGVAPTGRMVTWTGLVMRRIRDGTVIEQWSQFDTAALMQQVSTAGT